MTRWAKLGQLNSFIENDSNDCVCFRNDKK